MRFSEYQSRGFEGLIDWVGAMNPGSKEVIAPLERRLCALSEAPPTGAELWFRTSSLASSALPDFTEYDDFLSRAAELGGFHRSSEPTHIKSLLDTLVSFGLFEKNGLRENIVPVPRLQSYLMIHREVRELEECARPSATIYLQR